MTVTSLETMPSGAPLSALALTQTRPNALTTRFLDF